MHIFITIAVLPFTINFVSCESTKEPPKENSSKSTSKAPVTDTLSSESSHSPNIRSVWANRPISYVIKEPQDWIENEAKYKILKPKQTLTKIAKTLSLGFDPYFNKNYFEPFERRPKPVTLVALKKNGFVSRHMIKYASSKSSEIAELQSPYNELGHFWQDDLWDV